MNKGFPIPWDAFRQQWNTEFVVIGQGEYVYACFHDWLSPPEFLRFGDTQGLAQDSAGRIYVGHTVHPGSPTADAIAVFDEQGRFLHSWGDYLGRGSHGLDLRAEPEGEFLYHCDTAQRRVLKTTLSGEIIWERGVPRESGRYDNGEPFLPTGVAFAPNGDFYVADGYGSDWIHRYDGDANYLDSFGGRGKGSGKLWNPHGIRLDIRGPEPLLVVADRANARLQAMTLDGQPVSIVREGVRLPCNMDFQGDLMAVADLRSVVVVLDGENHVVARLGDGDPTYLRTARRDQFLSGKFIHPHDVLFLRNGDILVAERVPIGRITLLRCLVPHSTDTERIQL